MYILDASITMWELLEVSKLVADVVIVLIDGQRLAVEDVRNYHHVVITDYWLLMIIVAGGDGPPTDQVDCFQK